MVKIYQLCHKMNMKNLSQLTIDIELKSLELIEYSLFESSKLNSDTSLRETIKN